jgi:hypothetical protein
LSLQVLLRALILLLLVASGHRAEADAQVRVTARVRPDLQTIEGEIVVEEGAGLRLVDTLAQLPVPTDDVLARRTFPNGPEEGWTHLTKTGPGSWSFYSVIPRRYGASGMVPGHGLFMNGLWHPQPVSGHRPARVTWDVQLELPPGTVGVLNGSVGPERLSWAGTAERLALAVVPAGRAESLPIPAGRAVLVDHGPRRLKRDIRLAQLVTDGWPGPGMPELVIVEAPMHRRLARAGPGVLFVSDRAFRATGPLWSYHVAAVLRAMMDAGLPIEDAWARRIAAAAFTEAVRPDKDVRSSLRLLSWIPEIDALLYDGRLPFYDDVFDEVWPGDRVHDDLDELLDPTTPALAVVRRLDARYGDGISARLGWALVGGATLEQASTQVGIPGDIVQDWRPWPDEQTLSVEVGPQDGGPQSGKAWKITVVRDGPADAPPEPIAIDIDGTRHVWEAPAGPSTWVYDQAARPTRVRADAASSVNQHPRNDDRWPQRITATAAIAPQVLNVGGGGLSASALLMFRRQYSSRWRVDVGLDTSPEDIIGATVGAVRYLGPLQDRRNRPFRLYFGAGPSLLNPDFRPVDGGSLAIGGFAGGAWETRVDPVFPRHGHRLSLGVSGGFVPSGESWRVARLSGVQILPLGGRVAVALRARGGLAAGSVEHRLINLGGSGEVQGLRSDAAVGDRLVSGSAELRWQVLRYASLPLPLVWLSDIQLQAGADAASLWGADPSCLGSAAECSSAALGWSTGALLTGDVLGVRPSSIGLWVAGPVVVSDEALIDADTPVQVYLRITQAF